MLEIYHNHGPIKIGTATIFSSCRAKAPNFFYKKGNIEMKSEKNRIVY